MKSKHVRAIGGNGLFLAGVVMTFVGLWNVHPSAALVAGGCAASWAGFRVFKSGREA